MQIADVRRAEFTAKDDRHFWRPAGGTVFCGPFDTAEAARADAVRAANAGRGWPSPLDAQGRGGFMLPGAVILRGAAERPSDTASI